MHAQVLEWKMLCGQSLHHSCLTIAKVTWKKCRRPVLTGLWAVFKVYIWNPGTTCGLRAPNAQLGAPIIWSRSYYSLIRQLGNAYDIMKILSWIRFSQHMRLQNSIFARISNNGRAPNGLWQFLGAIELSSTAFWPSLATVCGVWTSCAQQAVFIDICLYNCLAHWHTPSVLLDNAVYSMELFWFRYKQYKQEYCLLHILCCTKDDGNFSVQMFICIQ